MTGQTGIRLHAEGINLMDLGVSGGSVADLLFDLVPEENETLW